MTPRTLFDKIWDCHLVTRRADGRDLIYIDRHVLHELHAPHAFEQIEKQHRPVRRPDLTFSVQDHTIATRPGRTDDTNPDGAAFLRAMREGSRKNGIRIFDLGDPEQGISHVVAPELGVSGARGFVVEYAGNAVRTMPVEQRMTLCNLNIEMGGRSGFVAPDESTFGWIEGRPWAPMGTQWDAALASWRRLKSDDDAAFDREHVLDCSELEPQVTWGTDPSQVVGVGGHVPDPAIADPSRR